MDRHFYVTALSIVRDVARETLENPTTLRENGRVIAGVDRLHGRQAVRFW
jgi:hypothetical protein